MTCEELSGASASRTALSSLRDEAPAGLHPDGLQSHGAVEFKGLAAVFGSADPIGDIIVPGAFARTLAERAKPIPLYWQHRWARRIGWAEAEETDAGLSITGVIEEPRAASLVANGKVRGLSFGYRARDFSRRRDGRNLHDIELIEVSVVTHPLHPLALISFAQGMSARQGENSRSEVEGEARQPGPLKADAPDA